MLNPYLEKRLFSLPVQPILVEVDIARLAEVLNQILGLNLPIMNTIPTFGFVGLAPVSPEIIRKINALPGVRMVHANQVKTIFQLPSPPEAWFPTSESRKMLEAEAAYKEGFTGEPVKVGVGDTGVDATHPQLLGTEFYSTISWPAREILDEVGHGCMEPQTSIYTTFCGLTTLENLWDKVHEIPEWHKDAWVKTLKDEIWTIGMNGTPKPVKILAVHKIPFKGKAIKVRAGTAELISSPWHPFMVYEPRKKRNKGYRYIEADKLFASRTYGLALCPELVRLPFLKTVDESVAYIFGLFLADGSWSRNELQFSLHKREGPVILEFLHSLGYSASISNDRHPSKVNSSRVLAYGDIYHQIKDLWPGVKSIPEKLLKQPPAVLSALLSGIIDGDGHLDKDRARLRIVTTEKVLALQLVNLLSALGFDSRISSSPPSGKGRLNTYSVSVIGKSFNRLLPQLSLKLKKGSGKPSRHIHPYLLVKQVETIDYDGYLYDLTTESGNYLAGKQGMVLVHNSHVLSTVAGKLHYTDVGLAVEGVSRARLLSVKCLGRGIGTGFTSEVINAIAVCYDKGAQVINLSLGSQDGEPQGGPEADPEWRIIRTLTQRGLIIVVAAGNSGAAEDTIGNPGSCPEALTVAAVDKYGKPADFSSRGGVKFPFKPDVAAPGLNIYSGTSRTSPMAIQQPQAGYGFIAISGTSMATPHIAAFCALLKHKFPDITTAKIKQVMAARGHAKDYVTGWGVPKWSYFA